MNKEQIRKRLINILSESGLDSTDSRDNTEAYINWAKADISGLLDNIESLIETLEDRAGEY